MVVKTTAVDATEVDVRRLSKPDELSACAELYRRTFAQDDDESINPRLLVALAANSGIIIGAHAEGHLIGFVYSFLARDDNSHRLYQYSQTAAVDTPWRRRGIGRALKLAQRQAALEQNIDTMRWMFDPLSVANAHFNLDVLGGLGRELRLHAYGDYGTAADGDDPTDRLVIEWRLVSERVADHVERRAQRVLPRPKVSLPLGKVVSDGQDMLLAVPADWKHMRLTGDPNGLREQILSEITKLLTNGFVAVSCVRLDDRIAVYSFVADDDSVRGRR